jgi:hypothetical protein
LHVRPVATVAVLGEKRLYLFFEIHLRLSGGKTSSSQQRREAGQERKRGTHGSTDSISTEVQSQYKLKLGYANKQISIAQTIAQHRICPHPARHAGGRCGHDGRRSSCSSGPQRKARFEAALARDQQNLVGSLTRSASQFELSPVFSGGEGGIRTHGTRKGSTVFETARFNRSRTSPGLVLRYHDSPIRRAGPGIATLAEQFRYKMSLWKTHSAAVNSLLLADARRRY